MLTIEQPFWRDTPLTEAESMLLFQVSAAHEMSAQRANISSVVFHNVAVGSGQYIHGLAAALLSLGDVHAPLSETVELLATQDPAEMAALYLDRKWKVPGWGNSFAKGENDPLWIHVSIELSANFSWLHERIDAVTRCLHSKGKNIFPNPSAYTAAAALAVGLPAELAAYLFIVGRLDGWTRQLRKGP